MARPRTRTLWILLVLAATFAAYAPSLAAGFTLDDRVVALGIGDGGQPHPRIFELQPLSVYFSTHYWADTVENDSLFRPLTTLSFALRHACFGDAALPAHLANVLLHLWATWIVWRLLDRVGVGLAGSLLGAAFFGLHALHTEVVATVVGRAELLAFSFGAAALLVAFPKGGAGRRGRRLAAAALLLFCALCSKEGAVVWIPLLLLFGRVRRLRLPAEAGPAAGAGRLGWGTLAAVAVPLLVFLALRQRMIAGLTGEAESVGWYVNPIHDAPLGTRLMTATTVMTHGLWLCLAPFRLAADYGAQVFEVARGLDGRVVAAALLLGGLAAAGYLARRRQPLAAFGVAAFFGALVTSNHLFPIGTIFGERLYFEPSLGVAVGVAWVSEHLAGRRVLRPALAGAAALWLTASAAVIRGRCPVFADNATLALHDVEVQPRSVRLQSLAGLELWFRKDAARALPHLRRATELAPDDPFGWNNLGNVHLQAGRLDLAEQALRRGLAASHLVERDAFNLHLNLGEVLLRRDRPERAARQFAAALADNPSLLVAWNRLFVLRARGVLRAQDLVRILDDLERRRPGRPQWPCYRGILEHHEGRMGRAVAILGPALDRLGRHPRDVQLRSLARFDFGHALLVSGRRAAAQGVLDRLGRDRFASPALRREAGRLLGR